MSFKDRFTVTRTPLEGEARQRYEAEHRVRSAWAIVLAVAAMVIEAVSVLRNSNWGIIIALALIVAMWAYYFHLTVTITVPWLTALKARLARRGRRG